jgi:hypothetical protein
MKIDPYEPINTLAPIGDGIWLADGPIVAFRYAGLSLPFPTRMTVIRLDDGTLWVHSPIGLAPALKSAVDLLGPVRHLIAPNQIHYSWLSQWQDAYPEATSYGPPGDWRRAARHGVAVRRILGAGAEAAWAGQIDQLLVAGRVITEAAFFHRRSRSLILTDLIENFEPARVHGAVLRWLLRLAGVLDPDGTTPRDMRLSFLGRGEALRRAVRQMIAWNPRSVVLAHGRWYRANGATELRRAFRWLGPL